MPISIRRTFGKPRRLPTHAVSIGGIAQSRVNGKPMPFGGFGRPTSRRPANPKRR